MSRHASIAWSTLTVFIVAVASVGAFAESHVRIVRLSSVEGQVQMDRGTGDGLERAIMNTPVVQGMHLITGSEGLTEVEFENQSALRITGDSEVKFTKLLVNDAGVKVDQIEVVKGLVYLDAASKGDDIYRVTVGANSFLVRRDTLMRLNATPEKLQVAVFKGDVQLENQAQPVSVQKNETLTLDLANPSGVTVAKGTEPVRFDGWNKERQAYTKTYAQNEGYGGPNRAYGLQDLNYYGDFFYANGYGYVWQPYGFANTMTGWDPYGNGAWLFTPGLGYAFASGYAWGWLPFHYGSWAFLNGAGWAWVPGGGYNGQWYANNFQGVPRVVRAPAGWTPALPPATLAGSAPKNTVLVGKAGGAPLSIPGGRVQPNFASVVPGRAVAASTGAHSFAASPNAHSMTATRTTFASPNATMATAHRVSTAGHVFAAPPERGVFANTMSAEPWGAGRHVGAGTAAGHSPAPMSAGGSTAAGHAGGGSAAASGGHR